MKLTFLGAAPCMFDPGEDAPCYLLNEELLVDCGWHVTGTLRELGCDIGKIRTVLFTHLHHDHYLGLAGLLFHIAQSRCLDMAELTLAGPGEELAYVVGQTWAFMQFERFYPDLPRPRLLPLSPGDTLETPTLSVAAGLTRHPVDARAYRIAEKSTGFTLGLSGDSTRHEGSLPFFRGCSALIHDAACGWFCAEPVEQRKYGHSSLLEAAELARDAGIPLLFPVHLTRAAAEEGEARYKREFPGSPVEVRAARRGDRYVFGG